MTKAEKAKLTRLFVEQYRSTAPPDHTVQEWVALKLGCSLTEASKLVAQAEAQP